MAFALLLACCVNVPEKITPVDHFNMKRYPGKWYEIARFDHALDVGSHRSALIIACRPMEVCWL
jgi:apolipoprotein D and lipocalin family protein